MSGERIRATPLEKQWVEHKAIDKLTSRDMWSVSMSYSVRMRLHSTVAAPRGELLGGRDWPPVLLLPPVPRFEAGDALAPLSLFLDVERLL
jgi:hypothetical protein